MNNLSKKTTLSLAGIILMALAFLFYLPSMENPFAQSEQVKVDGDSMAPTFATGDTIEVTPMTLNESNLQLNDIVVARDEREKHGVIVKRIVGLPGDVITYENNILHRNGVAVPSIQIPDTYSDPQALDEVVTVMPGEVYLLGDNYGDSLDSRIKGAYKMEHLVGKVTP